jgi:hypothetical protein
MVSIRQKDGLTSLVVSPHSKRNLAIGHSIRSGGTLNRSVVERAHSGMVLLPAGNGELSLDVDWGTERHRGLKSLNLLCDLSVIEDKAIEMPVRRLARILCA